MRSRRRPNDTPIATVEVEIKDLAFDGKSVGHMNGKVVFLDAGLPGETVLADITRSKPRYNQGRVRKILSRSERRIAAPCEHFEYCGGCTWQDLTYEDQLTYKHRQVEACIERIGKIGDVIVDPILPAPSQYQYRNKMEFSFHIHEELGFTLGLHRRGRFDEIFDLKACLLQSELANNIVHFVRDYVRENELPVYDVVNHTGYMRFLVIRQTHFTKQLMVNVVTNYGDLPGKEQLTESLMAEFPAITTLIHSQNGQKSNIAVAEADEILHGAGYIEEELLGKRFRIQANSFFQTNSAQTERLYQTAFDLAALNSEDNVLDLYCGTGSIGILLSDRVEKVVGVELVSEAVRDARENAALNGVQNIEFFEGNVKDYLRENKGRTREFNIVVIDPPRAGLHPKAMKRMLEIQPEKIIYISCNPATFSRDARDIVNADYCLPRVTPVDMFPHTRHIEVASVFVKS